MSYSLIIPVYNEENSLPTLVKKLNALPKNIEIIIIDGMEGYVKRELQSLEDELNMKLQKSLDNPLANR